MPLAIPDAFKRWRCLKQQTLSFKRFCSRQHSRKYHDAIHTFDLSREKGVQVSLEFSHNGEMVVNDSSKHLAAKESRPRTAQEFQCAIAQAQRYKDACVAAEDAAEEEARRRFKQYQDICNLEKSLHEKSVAAHAKLQKLMKNARDAGYGKILPARRQNTQDTQDESLTSHDAIRGLINRLERPKPKVNQGI
ncbi:hypothetical protein B0H34DRAFT_796822 [Crassisporium funariophilum]|nr:hypothetical protein B0H34DRAFT_796822 [Crassisporium funariophilum]